MLWRGFNSWPGIQDPMSCAAFEDIDSKLVVTSEEVEEGQYRGGGVEGTKGYKISSRMHCATWRI